MAKKYLCRHPSCNQLIDHSGYCPRHAPLHSMEKQFEERTVAPEVDWTGMYANARWRKLRKDFLSRYPRCVVCGEPATVVDHIEAHRGNEELFWDESNLQPLCKSCHSRKTVWEESRR